MDEQQSNTDLGLEAERARRLFLYLRDLAELRSKSVKDLDDYERVVWLKDLPPGRHGWSVFQELPSSSDPEVWLRIERVELPRVPELPAQLEGWVRSSHLVRVQADEPGLIDTDEQETAIPEEVKQAYSEYLHREWKPWQRRYLEIKPAYDFYTSLFAVSERRQSLGEVFELVLGLGLLTWNPDHQRIRRHMVTAPAELTVDSDDGAIELRPTDAEGRNRFELDMLEPKDRGPAEILSELNDLIEGSDPLALPEIAPGALSRWINRSRSDGRFDPTLEPPRATDQLTVVMAPAIVLRRRGQRTLSTLLGSIAENVGAGEDLPEGVARLVSTDKFVGSNGGAIRFEDPEIYFPLPSNDEQKTILDRMQQRRGVVVQGPPGTGKSHTIANLVTHLLAQGKRVLVTSHTERALRVLRDKLPEDVRHLCVSLLGSDRQSIRELEGAVEAISARQGDWSPERSQGRAEQLRAELQKIRSEIATRRNRLRQISEGASHPIELGTYSGTSQHIARQLAAEAERYSWIPDPVEDLEPPLTNAELRELLELGWSLPPEAETAAEATLPDPQQLLPPGDLEVLFKKEREFVKRRTDARKHFGEWLDRLQPLGDEAIASTRDSTRAYATELRFLLEHQKWTKEAVDDVAGGRRAVWDALFQELEVHQANLDEALDSVGSSVVEIFIDAPLSETRAGTDELIAHLRKARPFAPEYWPPELPGGIGPSWRQCGSTVLRRYQSKNSKRSALI